MIGLFCILYLFVYLVVLVMADCDLQLAWMERFGYPVGKMLMLNCFIWVILAPARQYR